MRTLVFPGQGVQHPGMGAGLFGAYPDLMSQADAVLGWSVAEVCAEPSGARLSETRYAQPAIYLVNALLALRDGPQFDYVAGHSLGEYNALVAGGVLELMTGLVLVKERAEAMARVTGGGMAAVIGLPATRVETTLRAGGLSLVHVAGRNADRQVTIAGEVKQLRVAAKALRTAGAAQVVPISVSGPFHTPLMAPAVRAFEQVLRRQRFCAPHTPVVSSVTGEVFDHERAPQLLSRQMARPVEWVRVVQRLRRAGVRDFVEINGRTLTGFISRIA
jgi:malonyl CoA-acyl carrier protein transacylase